MSEASPARVIQGKYRLEAKLGSGAFGTVYRATQLGLDKPVAIKVLTPEAFKAPGAVERFEREALLASKISHPVMAQVLDFGVDEGAPFLVMELVEGEEVAEILLKYGPLPPLRAISVMRQLASLLSEVHGRGIVHRDLKPANLKLLRYTPSARQVHLKVLDFGIAKDVGSDAAQSLTATGSFVGTPRYMSPEQVKGHPVDARSDLYSCGVIFYELLTGDAPFRAASVAELIAKLLYDTPPVLPERFPPVLRETVARLLAKDAAQRFPDAHAFDVALEQCEIECRDMHAPEMSLDQTMQSGRGMVPPAVTREGPRSLDPNVPGSSASGGGRVPVGSASKQGDLAHSATVASSVPATAPAPGRGRGLLIVLTLVAVAAAAVAVVFSMRGKSKPGAAPAADAALIAQLTPSPTPSPSPTEPPTAPPSPSRSPSPTPARSPSPSPSRSPTRSPSASPSQSPVGPDPGRFDCQQAADAASAAISAGRPKQALGLGRTFFGSAAVKGGACANFRAQVRFAMCLAHCLNDNGPLLIECRRRLGKDPDAAGYLRHLQERCDVSP